MASTSRSCRLNETQVVLYESVSRRPSPFETSSKRGTSGGEHERYDVTSSDEEDGAVTNAHHIQRGAYLQCYGGRSQKEPSFAAQEQPLIGHIKEICELVKVLDCSPTQHVGTKVLASAPPRPVAPSRTASRTIC